MFASCFRVGSVEKGRNYMHTLDAEAEVIAVELELTLFHSMYDTGQWMGL